MTIKRPAGRDPQLVEMDRVVELPLVGLMDPEELECFCYEYMLAEAFSRGERLFDVQATAVQAYLDYGGGLFPVGVGWGKSGISIMTANHAYVGGVRTSVLLVPAGNFGSVAARHVPEWRRRVPMSVPFHYVGKRARKQREAIARSGAAGCYVIPYSLLNRDDTLEMLDAISPELVIADEVQALKNPRAGTTKKITGWMDVNHPQFVGMSGTITDKSVTDYHHLVVRAMGDMSFLPRSRSAAFMLGQAIDAKVSDPDPYGRKLMRPVVHWARQNFPEKKFEGNLDGMRDAFKHRLTTAPGIVSTGDRDIGVSLCIRNEPVEKHTDCAGWDELMVEWDRLRDEWVSPAGDRIDHAIHFYKWESEFSSGFYNQLVWPEPEDLQRYRNVTADEAHDMIERAREHHAELQFYHTLLREFFKTSPLGLDTPSDVGREISQHGARLVGSELAEQWRKVKSMKFEGMPQRKQVPVRVCPFKVNHATKMAKEWGRGIFWVWHSEVGRWLVDVMQAAGLDPLYCPAGSNDDIELAGDPERGGRGDRIVVASIGAHGVGKNLQAFQNMLYVQWPRQARTAQQSIGRIHRKGQEADALEIHTCLTTEWDDMNRAACLVDAVYAHQTTGVRQKAVTCDYDPLPTVFSPQFLKEQGFKPEDLNDAGRQMLRDNFGWDG